MTEEDEPTPSREPLSGRTRNLMRLRNMLKIHKFVNSVHESDGDFESASGEEKRAAIRELVEEILSESSEALADEIAENGDDIEEAVSRIQCVLESSAEDKASAIREIIGDTCYKIYYIC